MADKKPADQMTVTEAEQALSDAEDAVVLARGAYEAAQANVQFARCDLEAARLRATQIGASSLTFAERLVRFLRDQPEVGEAEYVSPAIIGFTLGGTDMSLSYNRTGFSPGE